MGFGAPAQPNHEHPKPNGEPVTQAVELVSLQMLTNEGLKANHQPVLEYRNGSADAEQDKSRYVSDAFNPKRFTRLSQSVKSMQIT